MSPDASALRLAHIIKRVRPELDLYLMSNRDVEEMAGNPEANVVRRIFYSVEELLELHLSILEGVQDRYDTPFFDNLKKYAQRPIGTFHALPIARGKSVFKSDWIRDMGEFYGLNLFLAESSATTGGLDSLLEPTGNIKKAQDNGGARASAPTTSSSSPTAPRPRTRWRCRRCWRRATSRSSTATATSRTTTAWCWRARSRSMSKRSR